MRQAFLQKFVNQFVWNTSSEERAETVNLENPQVPINGFTLAEVLGGGRPSLSGAIVTPYNALKLSAVWRCINILSGIISSLPSKPYRDDEKGRTEAKDHSTYKLFTRRPHVMYTKTVYWERAITHLLLRGNHYARIQYKGSKIIGLFLYAPTQIKGIKFYNNRLWYDIQGVDNLVPGDEMIHVPHLGDTDAIMGKSTIEFAREDLGMEMARRDAGSRFWYDGGDPKQVIVSTHKLTPVQESQLKDSFRQKKREGGSIVAPFGVDIKNISMTPQDQEFIMSGNFSIAAICRWFGVPLHKLSELERATFSNIEHQAIEFMQDTICPIIRKIENEYTTKLYTLDSEENIQLEFDMNAYQIPDSQAQSEYDRNSIQNGIETPNEVRRKRRYAPIEGGDRAFIQLNMQPLDKVDEILAKKTPPKFTQNHLARNLFELAEIAEMEYQLNGKKNGHKI